MCSASWYRPPRGRSRQDDPRCRSIRSKTRYAYDGAGRLETVTTDGLTTTFAYDAAGNRESVTNPNLGAAVTAGADLVSVGFDYNGHGELTEREDARGATYYGYDKLGRRTCAADRGGTATWEYDQTNGTGLLEASQLRPGHGPDGGRRLRARQRLRGDVHLQRGRAA